MKVTENIKTQIINDYQSGQTLAQCAERYSMSIGTISHVLKEKNIKSRKKQSRYPKQEIVKAYKSGRTTGQIAKQYGTTVKTICDILKQFNVARNNPQGAFELKRNFWKSIDTPAQAYFLGWLISDGNIYKNQVRIMIESSDDYILSKFAQYTGITTKIRKKIQKTSHLSAVTQYSAEWVKDLSQYGVIPNKHSSVTITNIIHMSHLLRGVFDGDGYVDKKGRFSICGNRTIVEDVQNILVKELGVSKNKISQNPRTGVWSAGWYSKRDNFLIGQYLYKDKSDLYLIRKYNRWAQGNPVVNAQSNI